MNRSPLVLACVPLFCCALLQAQPLGSAFTFQGSLQNGATPASGTFDLKFMLFDAAAGGTQLGPQLCTDNLAVTDGKVTTQLDFGAQFAGQQRFLEVWVRQDTGLDCTSNGGFVVLAPRQSLTAAPNAAFSLNAATAASAATAVNATLAANALQLNSQPATFYQNAANLTTGTIPDGRFSGTFSGPITLTNPGNSLAGSFTGSGAALTGVNAVALNGLNSNSFLQSVPVPLTLSGSIDGPIIYATNTRSGLGAVALQGFVTGNSIVAMGVWGEGGSGAQSAGGVFASSGDSGFGVKGYAHSSTGDTNGVFGRVESNSGRGVYGDAFSPGARLTGTTYGGYFESDSTGGRGVFGAATAPNGTTYGVHGVTSSADVGAAGVFGQAAASGASTGVRGTTASLGTSTIGVEGLASGTSSVTNYGVKGTTHSSDGFSAGVGGFVDRGNASGVFGQTDSTTSLTNGVWGFASGLNNINYGVYGQSLSTLANAAGVAAQGNGAAGPGAPRAAALRIVNGAITVAGPAKPADKITVASWTCFFAWDDVADCNNLAYGKAPIGAWGNATINNNLIRADSLIYLTVRGAAPAPGTSCYAQVISQTPGVATIRVTVMGGGPPCAPCSYAGSVDVNYLVINPQ